MRSLFTIACLLTSLLPLSRAQDLPVSAKLNQIFSMLPIECKNSLSPLSGKTATCMIRGEQVSIKAQFNSSGKLTHLGLSLFSLDENLALSPVVLSFIERILLEYLLIGDKTAILKNADEEGVTLWLNGSAFGEFGFDRISSIVPVIKGHFNFRIVQDSLSYFAEIYQSSGSLQIEFLASSNLISGMDKVEYGNHIAAGLKEFRRTEKWQQPLPDKSELLAYKDDVQVTLGQSYFKSITSSRYYTKGKSGEVEPLFLGSYPLESFANMFLMPFSGNLPVRLNVDHRIYGAESQSYSISLADFLLFFRNEFEFYFGIEEHTSEKLTGTLIMYNRGLNFINLLWVEANPRNLFGIDPVVSGKFYTGIPSDNIKNLFSDFDLTKQTLKQ